MVNVKHGHVMYMRDAFGFQPVYNLSRDTLPPLMVAAGSITVAGRHTPLLVAYCV